jgi:ERF superfamily protein
MGATMTDESTAVATRAEAPSMLNIIAEAARDPAVDHVKLEALLRLQREVMADQAKIEFTRARHEARRRIPPVEKNGTISLGQGKGSIPFARFEDMMAIVQPILDEFGLSLDFNSEDRPGGGMIVIGTLTHVAGHSKTARMALPGDQGPGRNNLQAMGSTLSYGKRYVIEMLFNIVRKGVDDDGVLGGQNVITAEQVKRIESLLVETKADRNRFLDFMCRPDVESIPHRDFAKAMNMLEAKKRKMQGGNNG